MTEDPEGAAKRAIREHESGLLDELIQLVEDAVPPGATVRSAELAMVAAVVNGGPEIAHLFDRVLAMAHHGRGLLNELMNDPDGPRSRLLFELDQVEHDEPLVIDIEDA